MDAMASHITSLTIVYHLFRHRWKKHQSSASLAFVRGIHRWPVNSPHKGPVTWKMFPFDDVIMLAAVTTPQCRWGKQVELPQAGISMYYTSLLKRIQQKRLIQPNQTRTEQILWKFHWLHGRYSNFNFKGFIRHKYTRQNKTYVLHSNVWRLVLRYMHIACIRAVLLHFILCLKLESFVKSCKFVK